MIINKRLAFKPFEYQWAYDYWFSQQSAHWLHTEISMNSDIKNWAKDLNDGEKSIIENILKGFAQTETHVGDYWSSYVPNWFPVPEIKMMAQTFGSVETIHANAYAYLNDTLGLDDFEAFLDDPATMDKLSMLMKVNPLDDSLNNIARSLALFSGAAEGIQLFSSFAVLLSFRKSNRLIGIGQQMIYSVLDENIHSEAGCKLFRTLIDENPDIWNNSLKKDIYTGIDLSLNNEFHFIDTIFSNYSLTTISKEQLKNFMYDRANRKLVDLYLKPKYHVDKKLLDEMNWFYILISGEKQTDFFANKETGYSKPNDDWNENLF
jgi:ribonucleoside-diphosphate reductase beta chain